MLLHFFPSLSLRAAREDLDLCFGARARIGMNRERKKWLHRVEGNIRFMLGQNFSVFIAL
jgi:hypothetical protein